MEERNTALLAWLNKYAKSGAKVTDINTSCSSEKFMNVFKTLVPQELYPTKNDNLTFISIVILSMIREQGYLKEIPNYLTQDEGKNNQTTLFFLYVLYRLKFPNDNVEPSKAETMFEKFKDTNKTNESKPFNFEALQKQLEEQNYDVQQHINVYEQRCQELQTQYDEIEKNVLAKYQSKLESEMHEAAEAEKVHRNLLIEKEKLEEQISKFKEEIQRLEDKYKEIQEIEEENKKLKEEYEALEAKNKDFFSKESEMKFSGLSKIKYEEQIKETSREIEQLIHSKEMLKLDEIPEDDDALQKLINEIEALEEKVKKTDPDPIIFRWKAEIQAEIDKAKDAAEKTRLIIELGESLQ